MSSNGSSCHFLALNLRDDTLLLLQLEFAEFSGVFTTSLNHR